MKEVSIHWAYKTQCPVYTSLPNGDLLTPNMDIITHHKRDNIYLLKKANIRTIPEQDTYNTTPYLYALYNSPLKKIL